MRKFNAFSPMEETKRMVERFRNHENTTVAGNLHECKLQGDPCIIPDFLCPYKRYVGAEIEAAIEPRSGEVETANITEAEESTIRRWKNQFVRRLEERLQVLARVLMNEYEKMMSLLDNWQGLDRVRRLMQLFPGKEAATTLGRANLELFWNSSGLYF